MGKRSRKRATGTGTVDAPRRPATPVTGDRRARAPHAAPVDRRSRTSDAPAAPWSPFPLVELCILAGLICIIAGFVAGGDHRIRLIAIGFALVTLSSAELSVREHFGGFRSHTTLLAAICGVLAVVPLYFTTLPQYVLLITGVVVFLVAFGVLRAAFARRAGGLAFRA